MKRFQSLVFTLACLLPFSSAHAATIQCDVRGGAEFGRRSLTEITILHEQGKAPVLRTPGNIDLRGNVTVDSWTGAYLYQFRDLYTPNHCPVCVLREDSGNPVLSLIYAEGDCYDTHQAMSVRIEPSNLSQSRARLQSRHRWVPEVLGIPNRAFSHWSRPQDHSVTLQNCVIR